MVALCILFCSISFSRLKCSKKALKNTNNFHSAYNEEILKLSTSKYKQKHVLIAISEFAYVYCTFKIFVRKQKPIYSTWLTHWYPDICNITFSYPLWHSLKHTVQWNIYLKYYFLNQTFLFFFMFCSYFKTIL